MSVKIKTATGYMKDMTGVMTFVDEAAANKYLASLGMNPDLVAAIELEVTKDDK